MDFYEVATVFAGVLWAAIALGAIFGLHGLTWLIATAAVLVLLLAAKAAADLLLKRRP